MIIRINDTFINVASTIFLWLSLHVDINPSSNKIIFNTLLT